MGVLMKIVGVMIMIFSVLMGIGGMISVLVQETSAQTADGAYMIGAAIGAFIGVVLFAGPMFGLGLIVFNLPGYIRKQVAKLGYAQTFE